MIWAAILAGAVGCYALKWSGLSVPQRWLEEPRVRRVAVLLPVALLGALVAVQTLAVQSRISVYARAAGLAAGVTALLLRAPFLVVVVVAAATAALVRDVAR